MTYRIIRFYLAHNHEVITEGLTLEQAQAHCSNPETNSRTATGAAAVARTKTMGPWYDGYTAE